MLTHHWDFVDDDGCLHCDCGIGVIEPSPGSQAVRRERAELRSDLSQLRLVMAESHTEIEGLTRERDELRAALKDTLTETDDLREEVRRLEAEVIAEHELNREAMAEVGRLKGAVTDLGVAHIQAQTELETVRGALATEMRFHDQAVTEVHRLRAALGQIDTEIRKGVPADTAQLYAAWKSIQIVLDETLAFHNGSDI